MAELKVEVWRFNDREAVWNVIMFLCSNFIKREDKSTLNLLNILILFFAKIIFESWKFNKVTKREKMRKTMFEKERDISRVMDTLKSEVLKLKMDRK